MRKLLKYSYIILPVLLLLPRFTQAQVDVRKFGAKGDGRTDDAQAIQRALNSNTEVHIPANFVCLIKSPIKMNSNNRLIGIDNKTSIIKINADMFQWDNTWNPAAIQNSNRKQYTDIDDFDNPNKEIEINNITISLSGDKVKNLHSIIRLAAVKDVTLANIKFKIESATNKGHNAAIDLHSAYKNIAIENCDFLITTNSSNYGGAIWIQNTSSSASGQVYISRCHFRVASKDEMVAIYSSENSGGTSDILIENCSFIKPKTSRSSNSFITLFNKVSNVNIINNEFMTETDNKLKEGFIRVGHALRNSKYPKKIFIEKNAFEAYSPCIEVLKYKGDSVSIRSNVTSSLYR